MHNFCMERTASMQGIFAKHAARRELRNQGIVHPKDRGIPVHEDGDLMTIVPYHAGQGQRVMLGTFSDVLQNTIDKLFKYAGSVLGGDEEGKEEQRQLKIRIANIYKIVFATSDPFKFSENISKSDEKRFVEQKAKDFNAVMSISGWEQAIFYMNEDPGVDGTPIGNKNWLLMCGGMFITGKMATTLLRWPYILQVESHKLTFFLAMIQITITSKDFRNCRRLKEYNEDGTEIISDFVGAFQEENAKNVIKLTKGIPEGAILKLLLQFLLSTAVTTWNQSEIREVDSFKDWCKDVWDAMESSRKADETKKGEIDAFLNHINGTANGDTPQSEKFEENLYVQSATFRTDIGMFLDFDEFYSKAVTLLSPDQLSGIEYSRKVLVEMGTIDRESEAQRLDHYYTQLVKGAMVNTKFNVLWVPGNEMEDTVLDNERFAKLMWDSLFNMHRFWQKNSRRPIQREEVDIMARIRNVKKAVVDTWIQSRLFHVSSEVHMAENMVLQRLANDGVFPWLRETKLPTKDMSAEPLVLCFLMRRSPVFRYQFANTVGKRLLSERLLMQSRSNMLEHHRSAAWAEREYLNMYNLMAEKSAEFQSLFDLIEANDVEKSYKLYDLEYVRYKINIQNINEQINRLQQSNGVSGEDLKRISESLQAAQNERINLELALKQLREDEQKAKLANVEKESLTCDYVELLTKNAQDSEVRNARFAVENSKDDIDPKQFETFIESFTKPGGGKKRRGQAQ